MSVNDFVEPPINEEEAPKYAKNDAGVGYWRADTVKTLREEHTAMKKEIEELRAAKAAAAAVPAPAPAPAAAPVGLPPEVKALQDETQKIKDQLYLEKFVADTEIDPTGPDAEALRKIVQDKKVDLYTAWELLQGQKALAQLKERPNIPADQWVPPHLKKQWDDSAKAGVEGDKFFGMKRVATEVDKARDDKLANAVRMFSEMQGR